VKIAVIFHRFGPYHFARLRAAGRLLQIVGIESSGVDETYAWDVVAGADSFQRMTLFDRADAQKLPAGEVVSRIRSALDTVHPAAVVIPGWADSAALGALRWCVQNHVPAIIMSESTAWDDSRVWWKESVKRSIVGLCSTALVGGTPHADYIAGLGMPRERIFLGYDAVDNGYFAERAAEVRGQRSEVRKKHGLPERYFLASARFIEKKNLFRLIEAYASYRKLSSISSLPSTNFAPWDLVLLGDGPLRADLCRLVSDLSLQRSVHMPGFKQYDELPVYYGLADAFVHASTTEQWGLVVNEAMASGLPVLVSNRCGCAPDLVQEGRNGFTFDPYNIEQLAGLMRKISSFKFPLSIFGNASREIIANCGPDRFGQGLQAAVEKALQEQRSRTISVNRAMLWLLPMANALRVLDAKHAKAELKNEKDEKFAVERLFTETANAYSELFLERRRGKNFIFRERLAIAVEFAQASSGSLLDCATGSGEITAAILAEGRFRHASLVDISAKMLEVARLRISQDTGSSPDFRADFVCEDIFRFTGAARQQNYDLILCLGLIAHTGRLTELLGQLNRLLRPSGAILLQTTLSNHVGTRIERTLSGERYFRKHGYRISYFDHADIETACRNSGLAVAACRRHAFGFPFGEKCWAWMNYHLEKKMQDWAKLHGAEAMYLLKPNPREH